MLYILFAILMFGLLIAIHEFGHFSVAKLCGIQVNEFSIGMGPLLWHRKGKETTYSLRLLPIGGYCAMEGEDEDSDNPRAFGNAAGWKRFLVLVAGSAFNFLAGLLILLVIYSGIQATTTATIVGFMDGFPCEGETMLMEGDEILSINGSRILVSSDVSTLLSLNTKDTVDMTVRRNGEIVKVNDLPLTLRAYEVDGETVQLYGFYFGYEELSVAGRLKEGFYTGIDFVRMVWWSLEMLINGGASVQDLTGPVGIVNTISEVGENSETIKMAVVNIFRFTAFIAINLSVVNLLPIPALDGGRVLFLLVNGVSYLVAKRTIPSKYENYVHVIGFAALLLLMVVVAFQDVVRIVS